MSSAGEVAGRDREAFYALLTDVLCTVVCQLDARGVITYTAESVRSVLGYAPAEMVGKLGADFTHPDDRDQQRAAFAVLAGSRGSPPPIQSRVRHANGSYVHMETVCRIERDAAGAIVGIATAARDITPRVIAQRAAADARASLHALLELLPEPLIVHERGTIVHVNHATLALLDCASPGDIVGHAATEFVHPDDRALVAARMHSTQTDRRTPEHRLVSRRGEVIPVEVTGVPFLFDGAVTSLAIVYDLRERKRIDAQLAAADRMATLGRMAAAVGHEVNNPLTYVLGSLELLRRDIALVVRDRGHAAQLLARVRSAEDGSRRVRDIARDLKALASAQPDAAIGPVDLRVVLDHAIATAQHGVAARAAIVRADRDGGELPTVRGLEGRLIQVFVNLLVNAAQAIGADDDGGAHEIGVVTSRVDAEHVAVEILDTGHGFAADDAERLFEPFFTTKAAAGGAAAGGSGLGLSIARSIVVAFGGNLVAEPRTPRGACFRVTLRVDVAAPARPPAPAPAARPPTRRARVLFADDEPLIRDVARTALEVHDVFTATSGREVIDMLAGGLAFDAIICDLHMPDLGGVEVYAWIVAHRPELTARIAFMTGGAFTDRARELLATARCPVLDKPFDFDKLTRVVGSIIAT